MSKMFVGFFCCAVCVAFCIRRAEAQDDDVEAGKRRFGSMGQWAFSNDSALAVSGTTQSDGGTSVNLTLSPSVDYFVFRNLSLGAFVGFRYTKAGDNDAFRFQVGPRVGYNIYLADRWTLWPKAGISYARTRSSSDVATMGNTQLVQEAKQNAIALNLFAPVMFLPVEHFFLGFGPFLDTDLNGNNRATVFGGKLTMGGWLGGG